MEVTSQEILEKFGRPDVIWASPPCTTFSCASLGYHWKDKQPKTEQCKKGILIVKKTLQLIEELKPKYFIIENPMGMLRVQEFMQSYKRQTVTYCQYGENRMKPTDLWTNFNWIGRRCKYGSSCHIRSPRGSRNGTQSIGNAKTRSIVPYLLCKEILEFIEKQELVQ